ENSDLQRAFPLALVGVDDDGAALDRERVAGRLDRLRRRKIEERTGALVSVKLRGVVPRLRRRRLVVVGLVDDLLGGSGRRGRRIGRRLLGGARRQKRERGDD